MKIKWCRPSEGHYVALVGKRKVAEIWRVSVNQRTRWNVYLGEGWKEPTDPPSVVCDLLENAKRALEERL